MKTHYPEAASEGSLRVGGFFHRTEELVERNIWRVCSEGM